MNICVIGSYAKALVMTADRIPLAGETLEGRDYRETYGGKGSDMAVQAARLGAKVGYIGVVGDDTYGREFISLMKAEDISTDGIRVTKALATGAGFIIKDTRARNVIVVDKGANSLFTAKDIDSNIRQIQGADVVLAQLEIPTETALYALKRAKSLGKMTILNPAPAVDLTGENLDFIDIITPNETEARVIVGELPDGSLTNRQISEKLLNTGCRMVVMTLGADGVDIHTKTDSRHVSAFDVKVVDSNGAGDCFNAALTVALADGKSIGEAVNFANAASALCCTKWETVPSYHTAKDVCAFLKNIEQLSCRKEVL